MPVSEKARWQRLKDIFATLRGEAANERVSKAEELCAGDRDLVAEVLALLEAHDHAARDDWWPLGADQRAEPAAFTGTERFELLERLGGGAHGIVFRGRDRETGALVALKVLRRERGDDLLRFKREFRTLADRPHPGLVQVYELFVGPRHTFFTMELVDGVPLTEAWQREPPSAIQAAVAPNVFADDVAEAFTQLAVALNHLHREGLIHRDLKPSNVLRARDGRVVVLDFGLVTDAPASQDQTGREWGTPSFMAPELRAGQPASAASDWYAVGLMLDEALKRLPTAAVAEPDSPNPVSLRERLQALATALRHADPARRPTGFEVEVLLGKGRRTSGLPAAAGVAGAEPAFVGRLSEMALLDEAWAAVGRGRPVVVWIEGPSGVGKTALARHFLLQVRTREPRAVVLAGRCHDRETLGFRAFDGVLDSLNRWLRRESEDEVRACLPRDVHELVALFPVLGAVPAVAGVRRRVLPEEDAVKRRQRAFSAMRELLGRIACQRPLVLFIDDFQWADRDSLVLLAHVLRGTDAPACLLLATRRSDGRVVQNDALDESQGDQLALPEARVLPLSPLSPAEAVAMTAAALGAASPLARHVAEECRGMPFLVTLFVDELARSSSAAMAHDFGANFGERLVRAAVARLSADARLVLEALAVVARPLPRELAAALAGIEASAFYEAEILLRSRHLTRQNGDGQLEPYHDRVREAVVAGLDESTRLAWHARMAEALDRHGARDSAEIAYHWQEAGRTHEAARWALTAAREASRALAFARAVHFYELAASSTGAGGADTALLLEWAEALDHAGRCREAAATYLQAAGRDATRQLSLKARAGDALLRAGDTGRGRALLGEAVTAYGWRVPRSSAGQAIAAAWFKGRALWSAQILRWRARYGGAPKTEISKKTRHLLQASWALASSLALVDTLGAAYFQARHQHLSLAARSPAHMARALGLGAVFAAIHGARRQGRVRRYFAAFETLATTLPDPTIEAMRPVFRGVVAWLAGDWAQCHRHALAADELLGARRLAVSWEQGTNRAFLLASLVWLGRLDEHRRLLPLFLEDARTRGDIHTETSLLLLAHQHLVCLAADDPAAVDGVLATLGRWSSGGTYPFQFMWRTYAEVETALYVGDEAKALALWTNEWPRLASSLHMRLQTMRIFFHHLGGRVALAAAAQTEGRERAGHVRGVRRAMRRLAAEHAPWAEALTLCLGLGLERVCTGKVSLSALQGAERALRESDMILYADLLHGLQPLLPTLDEGVGGAGLEGAAGPHVRAPQRLARALLPGLAPAD